MKISELVLQETWNAVCPGEEFITEDNHSVLVRSVGAWNHEAGPDFLNAGIKLNGKSLTGAVEIHLRASDWFAHGHQHDKAYRKVILHVVGVNDLDQRRREQLPSMLVLQAANVAPGDGKAGRCADWFKRLGGEKTGNLLRQAGLERFFRKRNEALRLMLLDGSELAFLKMLFDAAGYKSNRAQFMELFRRYHEYPEDIRMREVDAILWGESGLLPDPATDKLTAEMDSFVRETWRRWWQIRKTARPPIQWRGGGRRPVNSTERRLAFLVAFIRNHGASPLNNLFDELEPLPPDKWGKAVIEALSVRDALWDNYVSFLVKKSRPGAVAGRYFALEAAVNVTLPALHAAVDVDVFPVTDAVGFKNKVVAAWLALPPTQTNTVIRRVQQLWRLTDAGAKSLDSAAACQGALQLYREYCEPCQSDCTSCRLWDSLST